MITICTSIKDRKSNLIEYLLNSMNKCENKKQLVLSVFDCGSTDTRNLEKEIKDYWKEELIFISKSINFSRSFACNEAVKQSKTEKIFICDVDMTLPVNFIEQYNKNVIRNKSIWFPVCFSLYANKKREINEYNGWWRKTGHGMVGIFKEDFLNLGCYNEKFNTWGKEDGDFRKRCKKYDIVRENCEGLFHNYHSRKSPWHIKSGKKLHDI